MTPVTTPTPISAFSVEQKHSPQNGQFDLILPTVNVISFAGPGETGGVPASLAPIIERLGTRVNWFALSNLPTQAPGARLDMSPAGFRYYSPKVATWLTEAHDKFAHDYLWPLLHSRENALLEVSFDAAAWKSYRQLCEAVASECLTVASDSFPTMCWLHDHQLALAAPILAGQAGLVLCQFWHTPWPAASIMQASPVGRELTEALLKNKLIGFHTDEYADNFLDTVAVILPTARVNILERTVKYANRTTHVTVMPLGIDLPYWQKLAQDTRPMAEALRPKHRLASQIILGVERLERSKGVVERLAGLEAMILKYPEVKGRFHYVQISQPGKGSTASSREYEKEVVARIEAINKKFESNGWQPIVHIQSHLEQKELAAWYQAASVVSVNSLADGLNLIAKEYIACRHDEQGVVVLSRNAGAARELSQGALLVDPNSPQSLADALRHALSLDSEEKRRRMSSMRRTIGWNQLHNWALGFLRQALSK